MSVQFGSHVWSKLLTQVCEGGIHGGTGEFSEGSNLEKIFKGSSVVNRTRIWFGFNGPALLWYVLHRYERRAA